MWLWLLHLWRSSTTTRLVHVGRWPLGMTVVRLFSRVNWQNKFVIHLTPPFRSGIVILHHEAALTGLLELHARLHLMWDRLAIDWFLFKIALACNYCNGTALLSLRHTIWVNRAHKLLIRLFMMDWWLFLCCFSFYSRVRSVILLENWSTTCLLRFICFCSLPRSHAQGIMLLLIIFLLILLKLECVQIVLLKQIAGTALRRISRLVRSTLVWGICPSEATPWNFSRIV